MRFSRRGVSGVNERKIGGTCGGVGYKPAHRLPVAEYPPVGDLPTFTSTYKIPLVGLIERQQKVSVPFGYINGTLLEVRSYEDAAHPVHTQLWSQHDDPLSAPCDPIVGKASQPSIRSIVPLLLAIGTGRAS